MVGRGEVRMWYSRDLGLEGVGRYFCHSRGVDRWW